MFLVEGRDCRNGHTSVHQRKANKSNESIVTFDVCPLINKIAFSLLVSVVAMVVNEIVVAVCVCVVCVWEI